MTATEASARADGVKGRTKRSYSRRSAKVLLVLMACASIALIISALQFRDRLEAIRSADTDNEGWVVAQLEVDLQDLNLAVEYFLRAPEERENALTNVLREFDIFYSRVDITAGTLRRLPQTNDLQSTLQRLTAQRDQLATLVDMLTVSDVQTVETLRRNIEDMYPLARQVAVQALQSFSQQFTEARNDEQMLFRGFFIQSMLLALVVSGGAFIVVYLWRVLEQRTQQAARMATMLETAFDSMLSAVIVTDKTGRILSCNDQTEAMFGYSRAQINGARVEDLIIPDSLAEHHRKAVQMYAQEGKTGLIGAGPTKTVAKRADNTEFPVEIALVADTDMEGRDIVLGFLRDISKQVSDEQRLKEALKQAEDASQAKGMFLSTMSHEMRTPLHGLMAALGLIDADKLEPETRGYLATAKHCSERALDQINDVLELTRMGESQPRPEEFSPPSIAADIVDELQPLARRNGTEISLETAKSFQSLHLIGLRVAFSRALYNLVGNAVKFTRNGRVKVFLTLDDITQDQARMTVTVQDNGIGIDPQHHERIFQKFETLAHSGHQSGSGLGLSIADLAVRQQGGQISLQSKVGIGSTFQFTVPLKKLSKSPELSTGAQFGKADPDDTARLLKVLVVDDNDTNLTLMKAMVEKMGHKASIASGGVQALRRAQRTAYDVILMDFSMPEMDGPTAAAKIRNGNGLSADARIVGVTALIEAVSNDPASYDMDEVLVKPVSHAQLAAALCRAKAPKSQTPDTTEEQTPFQHALHELAKLLNEEDARQLIIATVNDARSALAAMQDKSLPIPRKIEIIHKAVGSAAVVGLHELSEALSEAENMAHRGRDPGLGPLVEITRKRLDDLNACA
ncbi:ATP-binding protein [Thalassovita sp.]|uniref:ATP-binding protein n=1 Tax=Thalassovita sp. TaxID=1979401 RepID=UPI0029DE66DB|nr:ATP-binding protein [Thalassovita sp.]